MSQITYTTTATATQTVTSTPTNTATATSTASQTATQTLTSSVTATVTQTATQTATSTATATPTTTIVSCGLDIADNFARGPASTLGWALPVPPNTGQGWSQTSNGGAGIGITAGNQAYVSYTGYYNQAVIDGLVANGFISMTLALGSLAGTPSV